jgi:hypothetical protein
MSDPSSAPPPPPSSEPTPDVPARHEHLLELDAPKGWKRRRTVDYLKISPQGMELHHGGMLREPLVMPLGAIAVAAAESGSARALPGEGRFPVLRRLTSTKVVPREEGVEGWLWTTAGGSAFLSLSDEEDDAPNAALVFAHPLGGDLVTRTFEPDCVATVAARSPLGSPAVYGLLMRVSDVLRATNTFRKFNLDNPLTDKEVPPTLRRSLPTDISADPTIRFNEGGRAAHSVAPPGLA